MKSIIFYVHNDVPHLIYPAEECPLSLEQVAEKDVPSGVAFKIVDVADVPKDRTFREAWQVDMADADGVGADYGVGDTLDRRFAVGEDGVLLVEDKETGAMHPSRKPSVMRKTHAPGTVSVNIEKAKLIAHEKRRAKRDEELKLLDDEAQYARGRSKSEIDADKLAILNKYDTVQELIDITDSVDTLVAIVNDM